ncbi:MAG: thiol:disulfide interchange protein DsbA/DsbL [Halioglobus sp.]|nr:thiol:disulfide interchange protein DsbA/DsbL [Halioglobus sp.]
MIKNVLLSLSLLAVGMSYAVAEDVTGTYVAGVDYDLISPPVRGVEDDKIEVTEFFWYGCGHCYTFEPMLEQWKKVQPEDVSFRGVPAVWAEKMELHAKAYYAAEALGVLDTMNPVIFQAMNVDRKPLGSQSEIAALFVDNGVSEDDFNKAFNSFGVSSQVRQGIATAKSAKITGTPALMVAGKYHVSSRKAGTQADMLKVVDFLVEQERTAGAATTN